MALTADGAPRQPHPVPAEAGLPREAVGGSVHGEGGDAVVDGAGDLGVHGLDDWGIKNKNRIFSKTCRTGAKAANCILYQKSKFLRTEKGLNEF